MTPRIVIADFFDVASEYVRTLLDARAFRIVNHGPLLEENLDQPLEPGDTITVYSHEIARDGIRGELSMARFSGIQVDMPYKEACHSLPHFHINGHAASIALDGTLLDGSFDSLSKGQKRLLFRWISEHKDELGENWERRRRGIEMIPIGPWE